LRTLRDAGISSIAVVTGTHDREIRTALRGSLDVVQVVLNPHPEQGQLSSLRLGLDALDDPMLDAVVVALVDHPLVEVNTVRALIDAWRTTQKPLVRPTRPDGRHGHPVLFDRSTFTSLRNAPLDVGAKAVVHDLGSDVLDLPVDDEGPFIDVDTPEEYEEMLRAIEQGGE
jgi:molybdenum cofactor cytidylyltransferase